MTLYYNSFTKLLVYHPWKGTNCMEEVISGYCRAQDQSRTVMAEYDDGEWDISCGFPECAYAKDCPIGKQLIELIGNH